ncbi:MAG: tRNA pseudouridine(55) synthase TruB [Bacteroidales bacterium]|nr:tRNA pseudouridine(55) synthase TruB [Bacteroidales bacterium]
MEITQRRFNFPDGEVLLFNKPLKWTSFDVVNKVRIIISKTLEIKKIKVGHSGTLDPLADGLLILCTGKSTRKIEEFMGLDKEYTGTFYLGATTPSFDLETGIDKQYDISKVTEKQILETAAKFVGTIEQIPPLYSAINIDGKRAYKYARKKVEKKLQPRQIIINEFIIVRINLPEVEFRVNCSKGTYIRSLADDYGRALGAGAYLSSLRRTAIGPYKLKDAFEIPEFQKLVENQLSL